jgi:hypothetical protein
MLVYQICYALFCVGFAYFNAVWIKKGKRIYHFWNGVLHLAFAVAGLLFFNWQTGLCMPFIGRLFFDIALNHFRGLPLDYIAAKPKSIADKVEKKIFGKEFILPRLIYISIVFLLNITQ